MVLLQKVLVVLGGSFVAFLLYLLQEHQFMLVIKMYRQLSGGDLYHDVIPYEPGSGKKHQNNGQGIPKQYRDEATLISTAEETLEMARGLRQRLTMLLLRKTSQ